MLKIRCHLYFNPLSANPTKWLSTLKQFVGSVFDHFVGLTVKGLTKKIIIIIILQVKIQDFRSAILPPFQFVSEQKKTRDESHEKEINIFTHQLPIYYSRIGNFNWCKCGHCKNEARVIDCLVVESRMQCLLFWLKSPSTKEASHHPAFLDNCTC